ncbi:hypothetical protein BDAP_002025 [Binucleata daphniae]
MRSKKKAIKSLVKTELTKREQERHVLLYVTKFFIRKNYRLENVNEVNNIEKQFCKDYGIVQKTFLEIKAVYKKKGKQGIKQFTKNRKMNEKKAHCIIEFFRKTYDE